MKKTGCIAKDQACNPLQESLRLSGRRGAFRRLGSKNSPKQSRNSLETVSGVSKQSFLRLRKLFRDRFGHFWAPRQKAPGDSVETLSGLRAQTAHETPVRRGRGCKAGLRKSTSLVIFWGVRFSQVCLFSKHPSTGPCYVRSELSESLILTNTPRKPTCICNAPTAHCRKSSSVIAFLRMFCCLSQNYCRIHSGKGGPNNVRKLEKAGRVFRQILTLLEDSSSTFQQHDMLSLTRFGHFRARKMATGKSAPPSGTLLDFLLRDHRAQRIFQT